MKKSTVYIGLLQPDGAEVYWPGYQRQRIEIPRVGEWTNKEPIGFAMSSRPCTVSAAAIYESAGRGQEILGISLSASLCVSEFLTVCFAPRSLHFDETAIWLLDTILQSFPKPMPRRFQ